MKKKLHIVLFLLTSILLTQGCKKNPFDYRTKYVGDYNFVTSYISSTGGTTTSGTLYSSGKVEYADKGLVKITIDNNSPTNYNICDVDRDGNLSNSCLKGKFESRKKLDGSFDSNNCGGSMASQYSYTTVGTKK